MKFLLAAGELTPVNAEPSPENEVAVTIPLAFPNFILLPTFKSLPTTLIPALAVTIPQESTFVPSSYVKTPPTPKLPDKVKFVPVAFVAN